MFIGRKRELQSLEEQYNKPGFAMTVIYGRRRIGKSTLITKFISGKKAIFYTAAKVGAGRNLELFSKEVISAVDSSYARASFTGLEDVFDFLTEKLTDEKTVLVIDELPYWAEKDEALLSVLQRYIDNKWQEKNLFIILCGSSLSFMELKVLSEKSPLFGRRSSQIKLDAFNYIDAAGFVPGYTNEEKAICYGITGGVAKYLSMIDNAKSLDDNIKRLFFSKDGYLYDETKNLLTQEFTDITLVNNIIEQIAAGENTLNTIADKVREKPTTVLYSLERLIEVGLVERRCCITEEHNKKKSQYVLKDSMFKFWYTFIPKALSVIEMEHGDLYYDNVVKPMLHSFMGSVFEEMCRYYTLEKGIMGAYGSFLTNAGSWWGTEIITDETKKKTIQTADIDIVALSDIDKTAVLGECKFKNEKTGMDVYEALVRRTRLISDKYRVTKLLLFSLSGYTDWYKTVHDDRLICYTLDDIYG